MILEFEAIENGEMMTKILSEIQNGFRDHLLLPFGPCFKNIFHIYATASSKVSI